MAEKKTVKPEDELVTVQLFKDSGKYKNDVTLHVNGQNVVIQRGKPVQIKKKFAEVLEHSMLQDARTADLITQKQDEYTAQSKALGL